jgi:hypothetical protein
MIKQVAVAASLCAAALSASAMTAVADDELSQVSGQDGVSIVANLNLSMDSFTYTDTDGVGGAAGSVSFNNISMKGFMGMTIDIMSEAAFLGGVVANLNQMVNPANTYHLTAADVAGYYTGGDVVQIAMPVVANLDKNALLDISVGAIKMGGANGKSFGSIAIDALNLQGTTIWISAH